MTRDFRPSLPSALAAARRSRRSVRGTPLSARRGGRLFCIHLRYKLGWTREQIAAANAKVAALNAATMRVSSVRRSAESAKRRYTRAGHAIPRGCDVDHILDLQLGGRDVVANMWPLDLSVNRSLGAQIHHRIKGLLVGTRIAWVTIGF